MSKTGLTSRERLLRAIRHQDMDRVPVSPRYYDYLLGVKGCCCVHHVMELADRYPHDPMPVYIPPQNNYPFSHIGAYNDIPGVTVTLEIDGKGEAVTVKRRFETPAGVLTDRRVVTRPGDASGFPHIVEPPVKEKADLEKIGFLLPRPTEVYIGEIPLLRKTVGDKGLLVVRPSHSADQFMMDALGVENALIMYYDDRDLLANLLRTFNEHHRAVMKRILEQGADVIMEPWYSSSMSVGWSPTQHRELFMPLIEGNAQLIHTYGAYVQYYDDGKMDAILEALAGAGIDIVENLAPPPLGDVDLASAKKRIGNKVCLKGHIDQVNLICFGTPEKIRQAVRNAMDVGKPGSGFILGTADSIRPESPPENIAAYFEAALEFGGYAHAK